MFSEYMILAILIPQSILAFLRVRNTLPCTLRTDKFLDIQNSEKATLRLHGMLSG